MPGQKQSWWSLFSLSWGFCVWGFLTSCVVIETLLRCSFWMQFWAEASKMRKWHLEHFPWSFHALWRKIVIILQLTQLQMKLLLCPNVHGRGERLKAVVFLKTDRSGSCTWLRELPVSSRKTPSQWSVPCEMRQDLKNLSVFCWMDLLWATRVEIF